MYRYGDSSLANSERELQCKSMFPQPIIKKRVKITVKNCKSSGSSREGQALFTSMPSTYFKLKKNMHKQVKLF
jgi:hypothetical protein